MCVYLNICFLYNTESVYIQIQVIQSSEILDCIFTERTWGKGETFIVQFLTLVFDLFTICIKGNCDFISAGLWLFLQQNLQVPEFCIISSKGTDKIGTLPIN